jgi:hypothetical protein
MSVLFETPSGFAIFIMREGDLKKPDAMQVFTLVFPPWLLLYLIACLFVTTRFFPVFLCQTQNIWRNFISERRVQKGLSPRPLSSPSNCYFFALFQLPV